MYPFFQWNESVGRQFRPLLVPSEFFRATWHSNRKQHVKWPRAKLNFS